MTVFSFINFLLTALVIFHPASASSSMSDEVTTDVDLKAVLNQPNIPQPELYQAAVKAIEALQREPSCHRLAAATLIESCRALDKTDAGSSHTLDHIKSLFAARLAVCELRTAHATVPEQCQQLLPQSYSHSRPGWFNPFAGPEPATEQPHFKQTDPDATSRCLIALESRPQWWTSYSNARQTSVSICHVSRREIELANDLDTYREAMRLVSGLSHTAKHAIEKELELLLHYAQAAKNVQEGLKAEMASTSSDFRGMAADAFGWLQSFFGSVQQLDTTFAAVTETAASALKDVKKVQDQVQQLAQNVTGTSGELATRMLSNQDALLRQASDIQRAVASVQNTDIATLATDMSTLALDLTAAGQLAATFHGSQERSVELAARVEDGFRRFDEYTFFFQQYMAELATNASAQLEGIHSQVTNISGTIDSYHGKLASLGDMIDRQAAIVSAIGFGKQLSLSDLLVVVLLGTVLMRFNNAYTWLASFALGCIYLGLTAAPSHTFTAVLAVLRFWPSLAALAILSATTCAGAIIVAHRFKKVEILREKSATFA